MDDQPGEPEVVEFGPKRPPYRSRWLIGLAVLIAAGVAVHHDQTARSARPATPTSPPTNALSSSPAPTGPSGPPTTPTVRQVRRNLLGTTGDWELVARGTDELIRIQPGPGRVVSTPLPTLQSGGAVTVLGVPGGVIVRPLDAVPGYFIPDDGPARPLPAEFGDGGPTFPGPSSDQVWIQTGQDGSTLALVGVDGRRAGPVIRVPRTAGWPLMADAGYVLVRGVGGDYIARPDGLRRVTPGAISAVGPTGWLASECDDRARCTRVVIDRATGLRRTLPGGHGDAAGPIGVIAPDGSVAAVPHWEPNGLQSVHLIDLVPGTNHETAMSLETEAFEPSLTWSPDSRWLFVVTGKRVVAVDPTTRAARPIGVNLPEVEQLTIRR